MAREATNAIRYYSRDTDQQENEQYIEEAHGAVGFYILEKLRIHIYGSENGYFCNFSSFNKRLFLRKLKGISLDDLNAVLESCFLPEVNLFDAGLFRKHGILTSRGIQKRWLKVVTDSNKKNKTIICDYSLLNEVPHKSDLINDVTDETYELSTGKVPDKSDLNRTYAGQSAEEMPQIKGNKIKSDEIKSNENSEAAAMPHAPKKIIKSDGKIVDKKKFIAPGESECVRYFQQATQGSWHVALAELQAKKFLAHYSANGWVQNGKKPIVDWKAAANGWMLRELGGDFSMTKGVVSKKSMQNIPASGKAGNPQRDVEFLYQRHLEGDLRMDLIKPEHYQTLKAAGMIDMSDEKKADILQAAKETRIKNLTGSNQQKEIDLWMAYRDNKPVEDEPIKSDQKNLYWITKMLAVMDVFNSAMLAEKNVLFEKM